MDGVTPNINTVNARSNNFYYERNGIKTIFKTALRSRL